MILRFRPHFLLLCMAGFLLAGCAHSFPRATIQGAHVVLYSKLSDSKAAEMVKTADRTVEDVAAALGLSAPDVRATVCLFDWRCALRSFLERECPERAYAAGACFETETGLVVALSRRWRRRHTLVLLRHELAHYVIASHFYDIPPWIDEGLAAYFEAGPPFGKVRRDYLKIVTALIRRRPDNILAGLVSVPVGKRMSRDEYAAAWGLAYYLMNRRPDGASLIRRYLAVVRSGPDAAGQFAEVFGESPSDLEAEWRKEMMRLAAVRAAFAPENQCLNDKTWTTNYPN